MTASTGWRVVGGVALLGGWLAIAATAIPDAAIQPLGGYLRKVEDVTPDRLSRLRHVGWTLGGVGVLLGYGLWRKPGDAAKLVTAWRAEPRLDWWPRDAGRVELGTLGLITLVGMGLRALHLHDGMAYDEAYTFLNFARRPWYEAIGDYNSTNNHLLNTLLMHVCYRVGGAAEWVLRLPVFVVGSLVPLIVWRWGRTWSSAAPGTALFAAALAASAPALITYSTDARGYIFVLAAALVWDGALAGLHHGTASPLRLCGLAMCGLTVGLWAMPIMVYGLIASATWFLVVPPPSSTGPTVRQRLAFLTAIGATTMLLVGLFYTPAYIFRGGMFLNDPIMRSNVVTDFVAATAASWRAGAAWWTAGPFPTWSWWGLIGIGLLRLGRMPTALLRWSLPFLVVLAIHTLKTSVPPPRIYLWLFPWIALAASEGLASICDWVARWTATASGKLTDWSRALAACGLLAVGGWYVVQTPILIYPEERTAFVAVQKVVRTMCDEIPVEAATKHRYAAPLPTDLPSLFYLARAGRTLAMNGTPLPGEVLWLIVREGTTPEATLRDGVVAWDAVAAAPPEWRLVAKDRYLALHRSAAPWSGPLPESPATQRLPTSGVERRPAR
jgi:hypothetical protein